MAIPIIEEEPGNFNPVDEIIYVEGGILESIHWIEDYLEFLPQATLARTNSDAEMTELVSRLPRKIPVRDSPLSRSFGEKEGSWKPSYAEHLLELLPQAATAAANSEEGMAKLENLQFNLQGCLARIQTLAQELEWQIRMALEG